MNRKPIFVPRKPDSTTKNPYGYIYITTNLINNKKYLGQHYFHSVNENYLGSGKILLKAIDKYGIDNFVSEPIDWAESKEELDQKEIWWIDFLGCVESNDWYNLAIGGEGVGSGIDHPLYGRKGKKAVWYGKHHSEDTKQKLSEINTGKHLSEETKSKISQNGYKPYKGLCWLYQKGYLQAGEKNPMYGRTGENHPRFGVKVSDETKEKLSKSMSERIQKYGHPMSGKHQSDDTKKRISQNKLGSKNPASKPVIQLSLDGDYIAEYESVGLAARSMGKLDHSGIAKCCRGVQKTADGYKWVYKSDYEETIKEVQD